MLLPMVSPFYASVLIQTTCAPQEHNRTRKDGMPFRRRRDRFKILYRTRMIVFLACFPITLTCRTFINVYSSLYLFSRAFYSIYAKNGIVNMTKTLTVCKVKILFMYMFSITIYIAHNFLPFSSSLNTLLLNYFYSSISSRACPILHYFSAFGSFC